MDIVRAGAMVDYPDYETFSADFTRYRGQLMDASGFDAEQMHRMGSDAVIAALETNGHRLVEREDAA